VYIPPSDDSYSADFEEPEQLSEHEAGRNNEDRVDLEVPRVVS